MGLAIALALFLLALAAVVVAIYAVTSGLAHVARVAFLSARALMHRTHS